VSRRGSSVRNTRLPSSEPAGRGEAIRRTYPERFAQRVGRALLVPGTKRSMAI
jgi:hypothetical protein